MPSDQLTAWELMKKAKYELAYAFMTEEMTRNPNRILRNLSNRAHCLLLLDRPEAALLDFENLIILRSVSTSGYVGAGIALWWMDRINDAVEVWKRGLFATYTDAAGGVEVPAILYFAAKRKPDPILEKEAVTVLKKKWKTKQAAVWPGPIAGFLLGKLDEAALLNYSKKVDNSILKKRRLTKIHFWIGLSYYKMGDTKKCQNHLQRCVSGHIIESEYYLAKNELQKMIQ